MKLNLGACDRSFPGFLSVVVVSLTNKVTDLSKPWPWPDSSVDEVMAFDVFEHLPNKRQTLNELWRVLKSGAVATIGVPDVTDGDGGHCDPTHCSYWTGSDFDYFEKGNFARERFRASSYYGVRADFNVLTFEKIRHERKRGYTVEIRVKLQAVK